jgi:BirA family biotin operon repressor/biotin-[acetyl-CoA-carboxylase] ligase
MATSLRIESGMRETDRAVLLASVLRHFRENFLLFEKTEDLSGLMEAYDALLVNRGQCVRIEDPKGPYTAVSKGIDETGALIIVREDGTEERISSGEVSVRGLYGYV